MPIAEMGNASVFLNIMEILTLGVDQNAFLIMTALVTKRALKTNVRILVQGHVDKEQTVKLLIIFLSVHVQQICQETHLSSVLLKKVIKLLRN
jgi:hypothetical protein